MKKTKLLIPLIPISLAPLGAIAIPLTSCGGGYHTEYVNVTVQCDEHCHATTPTTKIQKGYSWANAKYYFGLSYDEGYSEWGAFIDGQKIPESYVLDTDKTITVKSCLESDKVTVNFTSSNHSRYEGETYSSSYLKTQKWSEVTKPTVVTDDGYSFDNMWFANSRITDDVTLGELTTSSYVTIQPLIKANNPNDASNFSFDYDDDTKTAKLTSINSFTDTHLYLPSTVNHNGSVYTINYVSIYDTWDHIYEITLPDTIETINQISARKAYKINMPKSLTTIANYAFTTPKVEALDFSNTQLKSIGNNALSGCKLVKELSLPKTLTDLGDGDWPFNYWNSLESIKVAADNTVYTSRDSDGNECNCLIHISSNKLVKGCANSIIPSTVTEIGSCALTNLDGLKSINIPASVTTIASYVDTISPFGGSVNLQKITVDKANTTFSSQDSYGQECNFLRKGTDILAGTASTIFPTDNYYAICGKAFAGIGITTLSSKQITSIEKSAFENCTSLTSIDLPQISTQNIEQAAFKGCTNLQTIQLGTWNKISNECFSGCENAEVDFSAMANLTSIGEDAFKGWKKITSLVIPSASILTSLSGFSNCPNLTTVEINSPYVTEIGKSAFYGCKALTSVSFGSNSKVTWINNYAFGYCDKLNNVVLPSTLTTIGQYTFYSCKAFTSILIPEKVTKIDTYAFADCENVNTIILGGALTSIGSYAFRNNKEITSISIPNSVTAIYDGAFDSCSKLAKIWIGSGVTTIGSDSRANIVGDCPLLTDIKISPSNTYFTSRSEPNGVECNYIASKLSSNTKYLYAACPKTVVSSDITGIKSYAYNGTTFTSVTIPAQITYIASYAFYSYELKTVTLEAEFTEWPANYSDSAFWSIGSDGTFNAKNSTVVNLVKQHWKDFESRNWTFNC